MLKRKRLPPQLSEVAQGFSEILSGADIPTAHYENVYVELRSIVKTGKASFKRKNTVFIQWSDGNFKNKLCKTFKSNSSKTQ